MIRLYFDPSADETHIGEDDDDETYCGVQTTGFLPIGSINNPTAFAPDPATVHHPCLSEFGRRYGLDDALDGENLGWENMGSSPD